MRRFYIWVIATWAIALLLWSAVICYSAMLVSDPIMGVNRFETTIDGKIHEIPPEGLNMLMIDLESLPAGIHSFQVTTIVDEVPLDPIVFQLVVEPRKNGMAYVLMVDEANAKYFGEPTTLFIKSGGSNGGGKACFIGAAQ